jgi:type IV secretory pathway TrbF-like protein
MAAGPFLVGLMIFVAVAASPIIMIWTLVRVIPAVVDRVTDFMTRRRPPGRDQISPQPLEMVVSQLRRLRRELRDAPPSTIVRAQALAAAYDDVLLDACHLVGVDAPLDGADDAERPFARLLTEAALEAAGIALDPPGSVTAG